MGVDPPGNLGPRRCTSAGIRRVRGQRWLIPWWVIAIGACGDAPASIEPTADSTTTSGRPDEIGSEGGDAASAASDPSDDGGTSAVDGESSGSGGSGDTGAGPPQPDLEPDAGLYALPVVDFVLDGSAYTSSAARSFYSFQPARAEAAALEDGQVPLFVFFNGGPGASSGILMSFNTGERTLDPQVLGEEAIADNPHAWTQLGHCLWLDARLAGFGYGLMEDPSDAGARASEFSVRNFNPWLDAADLLRGLLAFFETHPSLRGNPVVLVGESYGGIRAATMLDLVLFADAHAQGDTGYVDPELAAALHDHHALVHELRPDESADADLVATQFGRQILVQPLLAGQAQLAASGELLDGPDSPLQALGDEVGVPYPPAPAFYSGTQKRQWALDWVGARGRDTNNIGQAAGWTDEVITGANQRLRTTQTLGDMLGIDVTQLQGLQGLHAESRHDAYRVEATAPDYPTDLTETFGELAPYDVYYLSFVRDVFDAFYGPGAYAHGVEPTATAFADVALSNFRYVDTLITHGTADVVVWPPAIAPALATRSGVEWAASGDDSILIRYVDGTAAELALRRYEGGAHSITMTHPGELLADVADWL